ncbi:Alpha/Beta hydrolase protein [Mycena leptocephala]|nr:Alpha/Beta hydrolase protein [Mycena leptocephala]
MPHIDLQTSAGPASFAYTISTPTVTSATTIVQSIPTVILIHPVYSPSFIFHPVYADRRMRRFNLVTMDLRGYGWTLAKVDDTYGREVAAQDVLNLMEALSISACHVMGGSIGACVALQMAILAPAKMLSLFLLSPVPLTEPAESTEGRQEIHDYWTQGFRNPNGIDYTALEDAVMGALQLAYNNKETRLTKALTSASFKAALRNWGPDNFATLHSVTVKFFLNREPHPISALECIRCPIALVHCSEDIVYPRAYADELLSHLRSANLNATLYSIEGAPHFGNVTHANEMNTLLYEFVLANSSARDIPAAPASVESPFLEELAEFGLLEVSDSEDSD